MEADDDESEGGACLAAQTARAGQCWLGPWRRPAGAHTTAPLRPAATSAPAQAQASASAYKASPALVGTDSGCAQEPRVSPAGSVESSNGGCSDALISEVARSEGVDARLERMLEDACAEQRQVAATPARRFQPIDLADEGADCAALAGPVQRRGFLHAAFGAAAAAVGSAERAGGLDDEAACADSSGSTAGPHTPSSDTSTTAASSDAPLAEPEEQSEPAHGDQRSPREDSRDGIEVVVMPAPICDPTQDESFRNEQLRLLALGARQCWETEATWTSQVEAEPSKQSTHRGAPTTLELEASQECTASTPRCEVMCEGSARKTDVRSPAEESCNIILQESTPAMMHASVPFDVVLTGDPCGSAKKSAMDAAHLAFAAARPPFAAATSLVGTSLRRRARDITESWKCDPLRPFELVAPALGTESARRLPRSAAKLGALNRTPSCPLAVHSDRFSRAVDGASAGREYEHPQCFADPYRGVGADANATGAAGSGRRKASRAGRLRQEAGGGAAERRGTLAKVQSLPAITSAASPPSVRREALALVRLSQRRLGAIG